ncbi:uncharacterized protein LOC132301264 [Cornus florida]|uniref:uncharacterized protein LOC132301264 n=1 Tax=Cornus florida TaxID=4283 RepID=UPI0028A16374|nr:uncharacterized protein LOC132301264 [Cornus florida]
MSPFIVSYLLHIPFALAKMNSHHHRHESRTLEKEIGCGGSSAPKVNNDQSKTLVRFNCSSVLDSTIYRLFSSLESISTSTNQHSFKVNYLINSCGSSPETAISASKKIDFKTLEKPDSVLNLFENHGFSKTQISNVIRKRPNFLLLDTKKIFLPKFEFFYSNGISPELAKMQSADPTILTYSLKNQIIPSFNLLKNFIPSDDKFIAAFKRYLQIVGRDHSAITFPNIEIFREHCGIEYCVLNYLSP